ncbi:GGDEF domain-containing protein [Aquincola tertiaricarbonis]|uniref:diguanylate cyclase n=1 Tax=Aquincola tertiaricarbonis TaxID=391953 RepID=A0ABY4S423_AQUTE|nr:GGDEF domain-containing protein [Aquincola tertiaricarbonis]URI06095.1 GGDEF domain-containing protein [Aquincola tertiaricarbonis]
MNPPAVKALDPITRLPSAPSFFLALELAATEAQHTGARLSVLVVDADDFQALREREGDDAADASLDLIGKVLRLALGPQAVLARLVGDQFGVMLQHIGIEEAHHRAEGLREAIQLGFRSHQRRMTVSIGVACGPSAGDWTGQQMIGLAGRRRELAREAGGNRVRAHGHPGMPADQHVHWPSFGEHPTDLPVQPGQLTLF